MKDFSLALDIQQEMKKELARYELKETALIPCLYLIQKEKGFVSPEAVSWLASFSKIPESRIFEVLSFYTMFNKKPVGKHHIQVCGNVSCALKGSREIYKALLEEFKVKAGEKSSCGMWSVSKVECLGACDEAPALMIGQECLGRMKKEELLSYFKNKKET